VELTDPTGTVGALVVLIGSGIRHDMMPYVAARHPDVATPEDLVAWNAAEAATRAPFGQDLLMLLDEVSAGITPADHAEAVAALTAAATGALDRAFAEVGAEVLVSASSKHSDFYATAGLPAVTVPMGLGPDGRPVGITLIGKRGEDARLLSFAYAVERATQARVTPGIAAGP
jgi:amidase